MLTQADMTILDGPLDSTCNITHLTEDQRDIRKALYKKYLVVDGKLKTASGQEISFDLLSKAKILDWRYNGNVSVATTPCTLCKEINSCRPKGTLPYICLVKAKFGIGGKNPVCASCCILRKNKMIRSKSESSNVCNARGGRISVSQRLVSKDGSNGRLQVAK